MLSYQYDNHFFSFVCSRVCQVCLRALVMDNEAVSLTKKLASGRGSEGLNSLGKEFGAEHRRELFLQGLGLNHKNSYKRKMLTIYSLYVTPYGSIANVQMAEANVFKGKGASTLSTPFTCCSQKQVSRLHRDKLTAWELGNFLLSFARVLYTSLTSMALESHSKIH